MNNKDNLAYHYTSVDTFIKMLDGRKKEELSFHASSIFSMNDPSEFVFGYNQIWKMLPQIEDELSISEDKYKISKMAEKDVTMTSLKLREMLLKYIKKSTQIPFVISSSNKKDYLPQWALYGDDGKGVALGLNIQEYSNVYKIMNKKFIDLSTFKYDDPHAFRVSYGKIDEKDPILYYIKHKYTEYLGEVVKKNTLKEIAELQLDTISDIVLIAAALIKHKAYKYEQESRIIQFLDNSKDICYKTNAKGMIIPYKEVRIPLNRLKRIIVGPRCNNYYSVKELLIQCRLNDVIVSKSSIPYRG